MMCIRVVLGKAVSMVDLTGLPKNVELILSNAIMYSVALNCSGRLDVPEFLNSNAQWACMLDIEKGRGH